MSTILIVNAVNNLDGYKKTIIKNKIKKFLFIIGKKKQIDTA